jgi:hypothetical protein
MNNLRHDSAPPYRQPVDTVISVLGTDAQGGLSEAEARARLERLGRNELTAVEPVPAWRKFLAQFTDVLVILLLIATAISAALWLVERESALPYEAMAIFAVVLQSMLFATMRECGCPALPVLDSTGRLVGLFTPENVGEMMLVQSALARASPRAAQTATPPATPASRR